MRVGQSGVEAWVVERTPGLATHAAQLGGEVVVHSRTDGEYAATFALTSATAPPDPCRDVSPVLSRRITFLRQELVVIPSPGFGTTSGLPNLPAEPKKEKHEPKSRESYPWNSRGFFNLGE
jgi:hypothetical protein